MGVKIGQTHAETSLVGAALCRAPARQGDWVSEQNPYAALPPAQPYAQQQPFGQSEPAPYQRHSPAPYAQQWYQPWPPGAYPMPPTAPPAAGASPARKVVIGLGVLLVVGVLVAAASSEETATPASRRAATARPLTPATTAPGQADEPVAESPGVLGESVIAVRRNTSGTRGATYDIGLPVDFVSSMGTTHSDPDADNVDVTMTSPAGTMSFSVLSYKWPELPNGVLPPDALQELRDGWLSINDRAVIKGHKPVLVAGVRAVGVDYTQVLTPENAKYRCRLVFFGRGGTLYTLRFCAPEAAFARQAVTMDRIAASITFTGTSSREPDRTHST